MMSEVKRLDIGEVEWTIEDLQKTLGTTIKFDDTIKTILFLTCLLTYTDSEQTNVFMTGETCAGKTYDVKEVLWYYPKEDILVYHGASPTSFFHAPDVVWVDGETLEPIDMSLKPSRKASMLEKKAWREKLSKGILLRDLSRKIVVFFDMPHMKLLENLRAVLSHDSKICYYSITDRSERSGLRTKRVGVKGFFVCLFCSASTFLDEQEASRNYLLTPETTEEKIKACLDLQAQENANPDFHFWKETEMTRVLLRERVAQIKSRKINEVFIDYPLETVLREWFEKQLLHGYKPKDHRDMPRLRALAKASALLNFDTRKLEDHKDKKILWVNEKDVQNAIRLYSDIVKSNELGLSPEAYDVWVKIVKPIISDRGLTVSDVHKRYWSVFKRRGNDRRLRDMLKSYAQSGLCVETKEGKMLKYYDIPQEDENKMIPQDQDQKLDSFEGEC